MITFIFIFHNRVYRSTYVKKFKHRKDFVVVTIISYLHVDSQNVIYRFV